MKKHFFCFLFTLSLLLTACEARAEVDLEWYYIVPILALVVILTHISLLRATFVCPQCGAEFSPRWYQLSVTVHFGSRRLLRCPCCGGRHFCPRKRG